MQDCENGLTTQHPLIGLGWCVMRFRAAKDEDGVRRFQVDKYIQIWYPRRVFVHDGSPESMALGIRADIEPFGVVGGLAAADEMEFNIREGLPVSSDRRKERIQGAVSLGQHGAGINELQLLVGLEEIGLPPETCHGLVIRLLSAVGHGRKQAVGLQCRVAFDHAPVIAFGHAGDEGCPPDGDGFQET